MCNQCEGVRNMQSRRAALPAAIAVALWLVCGAASATVLYHPVDQQMPTGGDISTTIGSFGAYSGDQVYVSFTLDWQAGSVGDNEFYVLWFDANSNQNIGIKGNEWTSTTNIGTKDFLVRHSSGDVGAYWPQELTFGNNTRVIGLLEKTASGDSQPYNKFSLWVNPSSPTIPAAVYTTNTGGDTSVGTLGKRGANGNDTVWFRDIVVATTYAEALGSWTAPSPPSVQFSASADFNDIATGALRNKLGGSGFSGAWYGSTDPQVQAGDLASALYAKVQSGTPQRIAGGASARHDYRALSSPIGGEVWFSFLARNTASGGRVGLSFNPPGGSPFDLQGNAFLAFLGTDLVYNFGSGSPTTLTNQATLGQTTLVVGQMIFNSLGLNDTIHVWLDPDTLDGMLSNDVAAISQSGSNFGDMVAHLGIFLQTAGSTFDALYLSNTSSAFFDVTGTELVVIPEPATLLVLGSGLLALARRRRHFR